MSPIVCGTFFAQVFHSSSTSAVTALGMFFLTDVDPFPMTAAEHLTGSKGAVFLRSPEPPAAAAAARGLRAPLPSLDPAAVLLHVPLPQDPHRGRSGSPKSLGP